MVCSVLSPGLCMEIKILSFLWRLCSSCVCTSLWLQRRVIILSRKMNVFIDHMAYACPQVTANAIQFTEQKPKIRQLFSRIACRYAAWQQVLGAPQSRLPTYPFPLACLLGYSVAWWVSSISIMNCSGTHKLGRDALPCWAGALGRQLCKLLQAAPSLQAMDESKLLSLYLP